jgi:acyl-CoA synthetase (AMP-forming)/AMP-acid ligase II
LNALLRHCAETKPESPAYLYPVDDTFAIVSWDAFNKLVLKASAHYASIFRLDIQTGNTSGKQPTLALLGNGTTFEYWLAVLALLRLNLRVLVLSDKNAQVAHRHLLSVCDVVGLVVDAPQAGVLGKEKGFTQEPVPLIGAPELDARPEVQEDKVVKFHTENEWTLQTMIIHSSGSTGMPKPIIHTNRSLCMIAKNYRLLPEFFIEHWYICAPL